MPDKPEPRDPAANVATISQCLWVFAIFGPVFGYATVIFLVAIDKADSVSDFLLVPLATVMALPFALPFALFAGLVPAILVGIVYWALRAKTSVRGPDAVALSASAAVVVCACEVAFFSGDFAALSDEMSWAMMIVPGIVATVVCATLIERRLKKAQPRADFT